MLISRRKAITLGAASAGLILANSFNHDAQAWPPGPNENLVRDLKPGTTPDKAWRVSLSS
jgi:hypothetical protein